MSTPKEPRRPDPCGAEAASDLLGSETGPIITRSAFTGCPSGCYPRGIHQPPCGVGQPVPPPSRCQLAGGCYSNPIDKDIAMSAGACAACGRPWPEGGLT